MKSPADIACLVTGVAGFVGSHLAERLVSLGYHVVGVDNLFSGRLENISNLLRNSFFSFHEISIEERGLLNWLKRLYPSLSVCFHLAAIVSVPYSLEHPEQCFKINYEATASLLEEANRLALDTFIFAGSAAEYGKESRQPLREEYASEATIHLSPYGKAKYLASHLVSKSSHLPRGVALRCFNIYGPRQDPSSPYSGVISRFLEMARDRIPLTIYGDGYQSRDFIYVADVVEAYLVAAGLLPGYKVPPAGVYNVGTGISTTILDLAKLIVELTGTFESFTFCPERPGDIRHSVADIAFFKNSTGWRPLVRLRDGIRKTLDSGE